MLVVLALPGNEHQINPAAFAETFMINMRATLSARGFLLNFMPLAVIGALAAAAYSSSRDDALDPYTRREDWLVIPLLLIVAMLMSLHYNLGRIVMHAFPLFVGPAALALERRLGRRAEVVGTPS
jgi:hypothetical protein